MKQFNVQFAFSRGYQWEYIEAETPEQALRIAQWMHDKDDSIIGDNADHYDSLGALEMIEVDDMAVVYQTPETVLSENANALANSLQAAIEALNLVPSFPIPHKEDAHFNSYKLIPQLEKVLRRARSQS